MIVKPAVTDIVLFDAAIAMQLDEARLLQLAATAEADSEHPLAHTLVEEAKTRRSVQLSYHQFQAIAGRGV